jgi:hypothetical protein
MSIVTKSDEATTQTATPQNQATSEAIMNHLMSGTMLSFFMAETARVPEKEVRLNY